MYSNKAHFVLELVQNADDNCYAKGVTPHLAFHISPGRLVLVNNETGFTEENVKAICSVGASSKSKQKSGYIGEKGIGFKSVFTVSDAPEIHSNGFHFKFDRTVEGNLLGYVVPYWCEPPPDASPNCTTIVLPSANGKPFGCDTLVELDARLLLFLNRLRVLTIEFDGERKTYRRKDKGGISTLTVEELDKDGSAAPKELRYVRAAVPFLMKGDYLDEKRPGVEQSTVILAFPINANGAAEPEPTSHVFAFLPIRQMGFGFSIQADFILNSSRSEVLTDRPWNQLLRAGVAYVFSEAIETFKKSESLALSFLKYVPGEGDVVDPFFKILRKSIIELLAKKQCLLSASGDWKLPSELRLAGSKFRNLFPSKVVLQLFGFDYIDSRVQGGHELLRSLGTKDILVKDILDVFHNHGEWLRDQSLEWRAKFFAYVADNLQELLGEGLLLCACLPVSDGSYVVPRKARVFFPIGKGKKYGFESELVIVDHELYEEAQKHSEHIPELFAALNVHSDEPYELVNSHILPRHKDHSWRTSNFKALVGHLRYVKDKLEDFVTVAAGKGVSEVQAFNILREGMWIGTKNVVDGVWHFQRAEGLYFSKEYKPAFCLESLLEGKLGTNKLVSPDYLALKTKDPDGDVASWRVFFTKLGIRPAPAVESEGDDWKCSEELRVLLRSANSNVRKAVLECLSDYWGNYANCLSYTLKSGRTVLGQRDTKFAESLRSTEAPTKKRSTVQLSECYYPTPELKALLGDSLPYVDAHLSDSMLDACRVTRRVDAKAVVKRLKQLKSDGGGTTKQVQAIYRALDDRLWDTDTAFIKQAFSSEGLIQIKGVHNGWFKPSEVAWRSNGAFLDGLYPPLQAAYRDFSRFFCDRLGIHRELPTAKCVDALTHVGALENLEGRRVEALNIYLRASRDLAPRFGREVEVPDWIEKFRSDEVFVNHRGEVVSNDGNLFANDAPTFAALFGNEEDLSFLAVSAANLPRLGRLLSEAGLPLLSGSLILEVKNADAGIIDEDLTDRVRRSAHFIGRVLYAKRPDEFQRALKEGQLANLSKLEVAKVSQVELLVSIGDYSRVTCTEMAFSGSRILYQAGARSVKDLLSAELSKYLGVSGHLADTFSRILMESSSEDVEDFLRVRGVSELPEDLLDAIAAKPAEESTDLACAPKVEEYLESPTESDRKTETTSSPKCDGDADEEPVDEARAELNVPSLEARSSVGERELGDAVPSRRGQERGTVASAGVPDSSTSRHSEPTKSTNQSLSQRQGTTEHPTVGRAPRAPVMGGGHEHLSGIGGDPTNPLSAPGENINFSRSGQPPYEGGYGGQHLNGHSFGRSVGSTSRLKGRTKQGASQPPRTKTGRLLSYADGPSNADTTAAGDDSVRAAAREAVGRAAVEFFMTTQNKRWKSLTEMPHNNPGFDVLAVNEDGQEEYVEVKGQSGGWTEEGVALTPTELITAQKMDERYWLCVVEYAQDDKRRQLHLLRNPFGRTHQFRFDVGWKSIVESAEQVLLEPEKDMFIDMPGIGRGCIISVRNKGRFFNLHVLLEDGRQVNRPFNPAKMTLAKEPAWQG